MKKNIIRKIIAVIRKIVYNEGIFKDFETVTVTKDL